MASWIVHLRIAELLLGMIDGLDAPYFAIGNIAPDSGIPDENWENFNMEHVGFQPMRRSISSSTWRSAACGVGRKAWMTASSRNCIISIT